MNYVLSGLLALMVVLMTLNCKSLRRYYGVRRRSRTLEKYIGSNTPFGELVNLLTLVDMAANGEVEIDRKKLHDAYDRIAALTREVVLTGGRKNLKLSKELRRMGYSLEYADNNRHIYRLGTARISIMSYPNRT